MNGTDIRKGLLPERLWLNIERAGSFTLPKRLPGMNNPSYLRSKEYEYDRRGKIHVPERDGMEPGEGGTESGYGIRGYRSSAQLRPLPHPESSPSLVLHNFTNEAIAVVPGTGVGN